MQKRIITLSIILVHRHGPLLQNFKSLTLAFRTHLGMNWLEPLHEILPTWSVGHHVLSLSSRPPTTYLPFPLNWKATNSVFTKVGTIQSSTHLFPITQEPLGELLLTSSLEKVGGLIFKNSETLMSFTVPFLSEGGGGTCGSNWVLARGGITGRLLSTNCRPILASISSS